MKSTIKILLIIFIISTFLCGCSNNTFGYKQRIKELIDIDIPDEFEIEYNFIDNIFMHGRLPQYTVFSTSYTPEDFLINNNFQSGINQTYEQNLLYDLDNEFYTINYDDIPVEYKPNFSEEYMYLVKEEVYYIYYFKESGQLIVFIVGN